MKKLSLTIELVNEVIKQCYKTVLLKILKTLVISLIFDTFKHLLAFLNSFFILVSCSYMNNLTWLLY